MKKVAAIIVIILLLASIVGNVGQYISYNNGVKDPISVVFNNANSRDTYFSIHNIEQAHKTSRGAGIKVGVIDWNFGYQEYKDLYSDILDFSGSSNNFTDGHGRWMATVLKEIAPECEVYALGTGLAPYDESGFVNVMVEAIDWSIENGMDVLTLSLQRISDANRVRVDEAIDKAVTHGIVTTFIHCDNPNNILPFGLLEYDEDYFSYARKPDINVFHYDYNGLFVNQYLESLESDPPRSYADIENGGYIPFLSFSSMSPVTAGFVAILKSVNNRLTPTAYKDIREYLPIDRYSV